MAEPIFFDVLPKFGFAAMEAGLAKFKASSADAGKVAGESLTGGSDAALKKLQENYMAAANSATKMASSAAKATDEIDVSHRKMVSSSGQVEVAIKRLSETYEAYGAGTSQVIAAENRVVDAWARSDLAAKAHADTVTAANALIVRSSEAAAAQAAAHTKMTAAQDGATASTMAFGRAANTVGAVSAVAFTAAMYESAKAAGDFQQSQMRLVSSAGETQQGMKVVSDGLLKLAGDVGTSAGDLSTGMYTVESAGYHGADGLKIMTAAAQGAKAENADLGKVTDGLTTSMTDFHIPVDQANLIMSKLVTAVGESKANFEEFTGSLHSVEPVAAAAGLSLDDVYGSLARITQSGTSADQATQNMADAIRHLQGPTDVQAASMAKFGINVEDVQQKLSSRGLAGTMQFLSETIRNQMDPAGNISVSVLNQNAQAAQNAAGMIQAMSPAAAATAQAFANGTMSRKDFTDAIKASNSTDAAQLQQFGAIEAKLDAFSKQYKNGRSLLETYGQAMKEVTGSVAGANVALQLSGDHTEEVNKAIKAVAETTTDADGKVKGFGETQQTLNAKMADAKAAFGAAAIELGDVFIPTLSDVAEGLAGVGRFLAEHKQIVADATLVVGALGGAWLVTKAAMAVGSLVGTLASGMASIGGFVMGLAGKYDALAVSANAASAAEERAAGAGAFAKGGAAGAGARGAVGKWGMAALPGIGELWAASEVDPFQSGGPLDTSSLYDENGDLHIPTASGAPRRGVLPTAGADQYGAAGAQAARQGNRAHDYLPGATVPPTPDVDPNARPDVTAPGSIDPEAEAAKKKALKAPAGDKNDPIWIAPGSLDGANKSGSADVYNPFQQFATGGFTPASLVGFATTFALNQALGNPFGKQLAASKRGETPTSPLYVSNVDVDNAKSAYDKAVQSYGPDSTQATNAAAKLQATQAAVGTPGGYYDPKSGALTPHDMTSTVPTGGNATRDRNAADIIAQAKAMGFSKEQTLAALSVGIQETDLGTNPLTNVAQNQSGTVVQGEFQQDGGYTKYGDRTNPSNSARGFLSEFVKRGQGLNDPNPWRHAVSDVQIPAAAGHGGYNDSDGSYLRNRQRASALDYYNRLAGDNAAPTRGDDGAALPDLRDLFGGGGGGHGFMGNSPVFEKSPPADPGLPPGVHFVPGRGFVNAEGKSVDYFGRSTTASALPEDVLRGADLKNAPPGHATSPFAGRRGSSGGVPPGITPAIPSAPTGRAPGSIGGFPVPGSVVPGAGHAAGIGTPSRGAGVLGGAGATPPAATPPPVVGGRPASGGTGKGAGTSIGSTAASIASIAAGPLAPVASMAAQKGGQLLDRAIGYAGQLAGIGVSGLFETFGLNDSPLADPQKSVIGRIAGGFAGAHKNAENVAGQTQPPLKPPDKAPDGSPASGNGLGPKPGPGGVGGAAGSPLIGTMNVNHTGDPNGQRIATDIDRHLSSATVGSLRGGR